MFSFYRSQYWTVTLEDLLRADSAIRGALRTHACIRGALRTHACIRGVLRTDTFRNLLNSDIFTRGDCWTDTCVGGLLPRYSTDRGVLRTKSSLGGVHRTDIEFRVPPRADALIRNVLWTKTTLSGELFSEDLYRGDLFWPDTLFRGVLRWQQTRSIVNGKATVTFCWIQQVIISDLYSASSTHLMYTNK